MARSWKAGSAVPSQPRVLLTVDVEDCFQSPHLSATVPARYWPRFESRLTPQLETLFGLLARPEGQSATFFVTAWTASELPAVVARIVARGLEVGCAYAPSRALTTLSDAEIAAEIADCRDQVEAAAGQSTIGIRVRQRLGAAEVRRLRPILADLGFVYHSSPLSPLVRGLGAVDPRIAEIWPAAYRLGPIELYPTLGEALRRLPQKRADGIAARLERATEPVVVSLRTWEIDPGQPRISGLPPQLASRQYDNLEQMQPRLRRLLGRCPASGIARALGCTPPRKPIRPARAAASVTPLPRPARSRQPVTIVVPCYNEEPVLDYLARALARFESSHPELAISYVLVDDGSRDGTWAKLGALFGGRSDVRLVRHERNRGIAGATLTGIRNASTEAVCVIDCDCSYDPELIARMVPLLEDGVDLVTASPYHRDGQVINVPGWRLFLSRTLSRLYRQTLRSQLATYTACFRVYRRSRLEHMQLDHEGYFGIAEILARLDRQGARIVEHPAVLEARLLGQSKMKILRTCLGHAGLIARLVVKPDQFTSPATLGERS